MGNARRELWIEFLLWTVLDVRLALIAADADDIFQTDNHSPSMTSSYIGRLYPTRLSLSIMCFSLAHD